MSSEWIRTTIGEQATLQRGFDITKAEQRPGTVPVVSSAGVSSWHDTAMATGPGVVLGRKGVVGSVHFIRQDYWPHDTSLWVKDFHGNDPQFVYYFFRSQAQRLSGLDVGSANPTLNRNHVHPIEIVWPRGLAEQKEIARALGSIDDRITLLREANATLEAIAQALFKSWFVDFDPVRAKRDGRAPEGMDEATAALFPDSFEDSELGEVPRGWGSRVLGELIELTKGCSYKGDGLSETSGAHMFNLGCFNAHRVFANDKVKRYVGEYKSRHEVVAGDLILANTDMTQARDILGRPAFVPDGFSPGFISHHVFKASVRAPFAENADALRRFLFFALQQKTFRERAIGFATGTTVLALPAAAVLDSPACIPPGRVLSAFDGMVDPMLKRIIENERTTKALANLRDTLLPRLISGQLRLPEAAEEALA